MHKAADRMIEAIQSLKQLLDQDFNKKIGAGRVRSRRGWDMATVR
jgi:hypothetical protein